MRPARRTPTGRWPATGAVRPSRALLAALAAWDVFLDPRMAHEGYWTWPGGGRYEGVPATNFLGWWLTGLAVFAAWTLLDPDEEPAGEGDGALALYAWTWIGE